MQSVQVRQNTYLQDLGRNISSGMYGILEEKEFSHFLFFGDRVVEKSKTLEEILNLKNKKWRYVGTCVVIITRTDDQKVNIGIMVPS